MFYNSPKKKPNSILFDFSPPSFWIFFLTHSRNAENAAFKVVFLRRYAFLDMDNVFEKV